MPALPEGLVTTRRTATFTEHTVPAGLLRAHTTKAGTWGRLVVEEGTLHYRLSGEGGGAFVLTPGVDGIIPPQVPHEVEPEGAVRFYVEFLSAP